jgi:hypothetical protein
MKLIVSEITVGHCWRNTMQTPVPFIDIELMDENIKDPKIHPFVLHTSHPETVEEFAKLFKGQRVTLNLTPAT